MHRLTDLNCQTDGEYMTCFTFHYLNVEELPCIGKKKKKFQLNSKVLKSLITKSRRF